MQMPVLRRQLDDIFNIHRSEMSLSEQDSVRNTGVRVATSQLFPMQREKTETRQLRMLQEDGHDLEELAYLPARPHARPKLNPKDESKGNHAWPFKKVNPVISICWIEGNSLWSTQSTIRGSTSGLIR
jgi:hypothetical protein